MNEDQLGVSPVRLSVRLVDGHWEYFDGRGLPIMDGTLATLVVDKRAVEDMAFLAELSRRTKYKILPEGTELLVAMTIKPKPKLSPDLQQYLLRTNEHGIRLGRSSQYGRLASSTQFVKIYVGEPSERAILEDPNESGGVWLLLEGTEPKALESSMVKLPSSVCLEPADSLNHAFTLLSEKYEPWRKAHTGNIYRSVFYQEKNELWYPLDVARKAAVANDEHQLMREWWVAISREPGLKP